MIRHHDRRSEAVLHLQSAGRGITGARREVCYDPA
jgi:hypothetical protein